MPLLVPAPPEESQAALREALGALADRGRFGPQELRKGRAADLSATVPHQVFVLGIDDLASDDALERARPVGWRYLLEVGERVIASAETREGVDDGHAFSHLNEGPFVQGTVEALSVAEREAEGYGVLELRLLHVPALYLMSVWLQPHEGGAAAALFVAIAPAPSGFEANHLYKGEEFLGLLREAAGRVPRPPRDDSAGGA